MYQGEEDEELSEEDLPSDVDLSDPFFAEELAATGDQYCQIINQSITVGSGGQPCDIVTDQKYRFNTGEQSECEIKIKYNKHIIFLFPQL